MKYFHVSYDPVTEWVPRVPQHRLETEDSSVSRICFAPSIENCVNAKSGQGLAIKSALEFKHIPIYLYVYSIETKEYSNEEICRSLTLYKKYGVRDAILNWELWLLVQPKMIKEEIFLVRGAELKKINGSEEKVLWKIRSLSLAPVNDVPEMSWQGLTTTSNEKNQTSFTTDVLAMNIGPELVRRNSKKIPLRGILN